MFWISSTIASISSLLIFFPNNFFLIACIDNGLLFTNEINTLSHPWKGYAFNNSFVAPISQGFTCEESATSTTYSSHLRINEILSYAVIQNWAACSSFKIATSQSQLLISASTIFALNTSIIFVFILK